ncbi:retrovirus-related pol polyprotein from transposon TNT 1-94 [Tanacetum coccineum]
MSTSTVHQQSLADAGSETRSPMLKRAPRMQREEDLRGDDLKHYEVEIEAMNLIPISIPNDIYNSMDACTTVKAMWKRVELDSYDDLFDYLQQFEKLLNASRAKKLEKSNDPLMLVAHTGSSSRTSSKYYFTHPSSVVDYDDDYQGDTVQNNSDNPLTSAMILLAHVITRNFSNPTNNYLCTFSNTKNQAIVQGDRVNFQSKNSGNDGRNTRRSYVQEEVIESTNVQNDAGNIQRTLRTTSSGTIANVQCYNCSEKVVLTYEQNYFLFADASRIEEIEELSANICLMAKIQPTNIDSEAGPSCNSAFLSEVQTPSTSYVNLLFARDNQDGSVEEDNNVQQSYEFEQLTRNAYREAEKQQIIAKKVQQQNIVLTKQLESYKEKVQELSDEQKYFPPSFISSEDPSNESSPYSSSEKNPTNKSMPRANPILVDLNQMENDFQKLFELLEMASKRENIFYTSLEEIQLNDFYNDMHDEIKKVQRDSIEIQEGMKKCINILEHDVQRCQKQSLDFELQLQHEKEKRKCESSLKSTRAQTQGEINELIENVKQNTYSYADVRAQNQDLLMTISKLKSKLKNVENGLSATSSVRRPSNRDSSFKNSVVSNTKNSSEKVEVFYRTNQKPDVASKNVVLNTIVTNDEIKNALIAKNVLCVSCAKNVLIPCHDNCLAKYKFIVHSKVRRALFTTPRIVKSMFKDTTLVVSKTRFSVRTIQYQSLDTTPIVSKDKIDAITPLSDKNKVSSAFTVRDNSLSNYMKNKIQTSQMWQKWCELQPNVGWSPAKESLHVNNGRSTVVQIILWIVDSGCSKHMIGDRSLMKIFVEKFMGTVRFGNDHFAAIIGYGDYVQGNITICQVYYVEGLGHNLFSVGKFCGGDLEVAFRSKTCYVRNLEGDDLLTGDRDSNLYIISIPDMAASSPVCLMSKASSTKSWLWPQTLHLNFGTINDLTKHDLVDGLSKFKYGKDHICSACERGKSKKSSHPPKMVLSTHSKLELLHMDLCRPMRVASINGKKYILVIVDDYSRFTWVYFLRTKDETS